MFYTNLIYWSLTLSQVNCYQGPKNGRLIISLGLWERTLAYTGLLSRKKMICAVYSEYNCFTSIWLRSDSWVWLKFGVLLERACVACYRSEYASVKDFKAIYDEISCSLWLHVNYLSGFAKTWLQISLLNTLWLSRVVEHVFFVIVTFYVFYRYRIGHSR